MPLTPEYRAYLEELFAPIGRIGFKRAFGLDALIADGAMFGIVIDERIHLRTDAETRPLYEAEGGRPFAFKKLSTGEDIVTSYVSMPDRLYDDPDELAVWAKRAYEAAQKSPSATQRRKKRERAARSTPGRARPAKRSKSRRGK